MRTAASWGRRLRAALVLALACGLAGCLQFPASKTQTLLNQMSLAYGAARTPIPAGVYYDQALGKRYEITLDPHPRAPLYKVNGSRQVILYRIGEEGWLAVVFGASITAHWLRYDGARREIRFTRLDCADIQDHHLKALKIRRDLDGACWTEDAFVLVALAKYAIREIQAGRATPATTTLLPQKPQRRTATPPPAAARPSPPSAKGEGALSLENRLKNGVLDIPGFGRPLYGFEAGGRLVRYLPRRGPGGAPLIVGAGRYRLDGDRLCLEIKNAGRRCMSLVERADFKIDAVEGDQRHRDVLILKPFQNFPWPPPRGLGRGGASGLLGVPAPRPLP